VTRTLPTRVLGIDPGTAVTGWGVVEAGSPGLSRVASGVLKLSSRSAIGERLRVIRARVLELVAAHHPSAIALEKVFVSRNVQSAFRLGEARGAVLIAAAEAAIPIFEYAPAEVKSTVVGYGQADKAQIMRGVAMRLSLGPLFLADEADALALAICHLAGAKLRALQAGAAPSAAKIEAPRRVPRPLP
jgi:crossover junction endodeoxyribonuclease RuvC